MGISAGPDMIQDGLVLALDASDRNSYVSGSTTWNDLSGNNNSGTIANSPVYSNSNNGILAFNGSNNNVSIANSNTYLTGSYFTYSTWVNIPTISVAFTLYSILNKNIYNTSGISITVGAGGNAANQIQTSNIRMSVSGNLATAPQFIFPNNVILYNTWNQFTYVVNYDGINTLLSCYINGGNTYSSTTTIGSGSFVGNTTALSIGAPGPGNGSYFSGSIANTQIYNRALSATEILQNYNATKTRFNL